MARKVPCSNCGELGWPSSHPNPPPRTCRKCRALGFGQRKKPVRVKPYKHGYNTKHKTPCIDCSQPSWGKRCRRCADRAQRIRSADDSRVQRWVRDRDTPGLTQKQRLQVRAQWLRQGRSCIYCSDVATTIDHVLPLVRGGTNYEGNLAPCCKRCNSSKAGFTVAEWRHGRRLPPMRGALPWNARRPKLKLMRWAEQELLPICVACGAGHDRRSDYCSGRCQMRSRYRIEAGIPVSDPIKKVGRPRAS